MRTSEEERGICCENKVVVVVGCRNSSSGVHGSRSTDSDGKHTRELQSDEAGVEWLHFGSANPKRIDN
jgi:hypothetical protein